MPPDLQYYQLLLKKSMPLNDIESLGFCQRLLNNPSKIDMDHAKARIKVFLKEKKLTSSEKLGDFLAKYDRILALLVFTTANIQAIKYSYV